ncbi:MAG: hypothetical protein NC251_06275 [Lachnoclostridium sp.]|nr:hypothetical protein [Lachnoclostridium sp.]
MMKRMRKILRKKMLSALLTMAIMAVCLSGCGNAPAVADNMENSTETTVDTDTGTTTKTEGGETTETEIKDGAVAGSDKPAGTASPTAEPSATGKPESTAEPTASPTAKPQATATPEPTAPPHVHEYVESITKQPTCAEAGVKTLTCSCGDVKTEAVAATGHDFVTQYTTITHDALGHVEQVQVQVGTGSTKQVYECTYCGHQQDHPLGDHWEAAASAGEPFEHAIAAQTYIYDIPGDPIYETTSSWIVDVPAWSENVPNGSVCTKCGVAGP